MNEQETAYELIVEAVESLYNIFDHDETSCIFCTICGAKAEPREGALYDYRDVVHHKGCIVAKMQAWLERQEQEGQGGER